MTSEMKAKIDSMSYEQMLRQWRFAPVGNPMFQGEVGDYFAKRMNELRAKPDGDKQHVNASKTIGWAGA